MITAVDTNVISAIWSNETNAEQISQVLNQSAVQGPVLIAAPVYAELAAHPVTQASLQRAFFEQTAVQIDWETSRQIWISAGEAFALYSKRRRGSAVFGPKRFLQDFLIGAHALHRADRLFTLDQRVYRTYFPTLALLAVHEPL